MECNFLFQKKEITMTTVIHPSYFPNIEYFSYLLNSEDISFEINDFYQKQTLRNRTSIYGSNGKLDLVIPVKFIKTLPSDVSWKSLILPKHPTL